MAGMSLLLSGTCSSAHGHRQLTDITALQTDFSVIARKFLSQLTSQACVGAPTTLNCADSEDILPEQFVEFYYKTFDENRTNLAALYVSESTILPS